MAFGRKNKERPDRDAYGQKDIPYMTNEKAMDNYGIKPIRGRSEKNARWATRIILAFFILLIIFLFFSSCSSLLSSGKVSGLKEDVQKNASPAFKSRYDSLGASIIQSYFAQKNPPVNLLQQANWPTTNGESSGSQSESAPVEVQGLSLIDAYETPYSADAIKEKKDKQIFTNPRNEVLKYSGVIDGKQYEFGIYLIIPNIDEPRQLPYLVSPPTILPMSKLVNANIDGSKPTGDMFTEAKLNDGTIKNISRWASAYAQGDADTLKSLANDGRVEATYPGVGGFTLQGEPTVEWAYQYADKNTDEQRIVARVSFTMSSEVSSQSSNTGKDKDISGSNSNNKLAPKQVMDILLGNFQEGSADILAWGPGGMWQTLQPRMNAVLPVVVKGEKADEDVINPTRTDSSDESGAPESSDTSSTDSSATSSSGVPGAPSLTNNTDSSTTSSTPTQKKKPHSTHKKTPPQKRKDASHHSHSDNK